MKQDNSSQRRVRRSARQWAALIEAQARSGLSIVAFCRARGLSASSFYHWRRLLEDGEAPPAPAGGFVRLRTADDVAADAGAPGSSGGGSAVLPRGGGDDPDDLARPHPVVVRFTDGVELHIDGRRLGEVLARLRAGSAERGPA